MPHRDGDGSHNEWEDEYMRGYKDGYAEARRDLKHHLEHLVGKAYAGSEVVEWMRDHLASE